jgi:hypothetical protein
MAHAGHTAPDVREHVDDRAAVIAHPLCKTFARHQESAVQVVAHHRVPAVQRDLVERRGKLAACAIEEAVEPVEIGDCRGDDVFDARFVADVAGVAAHAFGAFRVVLGQLGAHGFQLRQGSSDQDHRCSQRDQFVRGTSAKPAASARHHDNLAGEQAGAENGTVLMRTVAVVRIGFHDSQRNWVSAPQCA